MQFNKKKMFIKQKKMERMFLSLNTMPTRNLIEIKLDRKKKWFTLYSNNEGNICNNYVCDVFIFCGIRFSTFQMRTIFFMNIFSFDKKLCFKPEKERVRRI